ncbi:hypothetical protein [Gudongella sp. DL1XJH-153]|uniref:hypothetical protein n=1 Tax=Gudongella sp. DL1XJH-153 TaxID=3409804 RepID=UPI003BB6715D
MSKNRNKQRTNRRKYKPHEAMESRLKSENEFGIKDPTPQEAVSNIINEQYQHDDKIDIKR